MELLDKAKVLKTIEKLDVHDGMRVVTADRLCGFEWTKGDMYGLIKDMTGCKWTRVEDGLPELKEDEYGDYRSDHVLVWLSNDYDGVQYMICYHFKNADEEESWLIPSMLCYDWHDIHSGRVHPIAWMPLPEPYKEDKA